MTSPSAMNRFLAAHYNTVDNNRCILPSERHISPPFEIFEDDTTDSFFITPDFWATDSSPGVQDFPTADIENPCLHPQEIWDARYGTTTTHPARTWLTVELNEAVEASRAIADISTSYGSNMRFRDTREQIFHQRLQLWIGRLEDRFCRDVCGWALKYAPEKPIFGLVTDFSRVAIMRVYRKSRWMTTEDVEAFKELLVALKFWACCNGVEMEPMSPQEAGGSSKQGVCNLATICVPGGSRPLNCPVMERRTAWTEIMGLVMEQWAGSMKMGVAAMIFNMLEDVLPKWTYDPDVKKQRRRADVINRFIRAPVF